jgi:lipase
VGRWSGAGTPVLAAHGITAHHQSWSWVADAIPDRELLAPDLRGRGRSRALPPYGMAAHADDLMAVLDAHGHERAILLGHSMGAYVALVAAQRHPERVEGLVLVDGGIPLPTPPGMDPDDVAQAVIGPSLRRLEMRFPDVEAHRELWRTHPALGGEWGPRLAAYADADLHGDEPSLASRTVREAVDFDSRDLLTGPDVPAAQVALDRRSVLLVAEQGMAVGAPPLYPDATVAAAADAHLTLEIRRVRGVNHYTVVMSDVGAHAVARAIKAAGTAPADR